MDLKNGYLGKFPKANIILSIIFGVLLWCYGIKAYYEILSLEETGGERSMPRFFWWLYDLFGAFGILGFFILAGLFFFYRAFDAYKEVQKQTNEQVD